MKEFLKNNRVYLVIYLITLIVLAYVLLNHGKVQIHQHINSIVGNELANTFFKYITHIGDGIFAIVLSLVVLWFNVKKGLYLLLSYASASACTAILKTFVFIKVWRPSFVFQYFVHEDLNVVSGVDLHIGNSFPSGHSTAAFAIFMSLLFITHNQLYKSIFFVLALLAAFSRTYLSQHWLVDIYVGSIIGAGFSMLMYVVFYQKQLSSKLNVTLPELISSKK